MQKSTNSVVCLKHRVSLSGTKCPACTSRHHESVLRDMLRRYRADYEKLHGPVKWKVAI